MRFARVWILFQFCVLATGSRPDRRDSAELTVFTDAGRHEHKLGVRGTHGGGDERAGGGDSAKEVVYTPWWPPWSEKKYESVGVLSHNLLFMTGMMEFNHTLLAKATQITYDVRDICVGGRTNLANLLSCVVNAPPQGAKRVRATFESVLHNATRGSPVALTVVEMAGEYPFVDVSATCQAALPVAGPKTSARLPSGATAVRAGDVTHLTACGETAAQTQGALSSLLTSSGGHGLKDLVDCTAFLRNITDAPSVRKLFQPESSPSDPAPALTIVQAGLEDHMRMCLRCTASASPKSAITGTPGVYAVQAGGLVYVQGLPDKVNNATTALAELGAVLTRAGTSLSEVVNCEFFVHNITTMKDVFGGFYKVFNVQNPPPPSRTEWTTASECADCSVLTKCIAGTRLARR